jgi:DNA-binding PadR family transcriptional regulator
MAGATGLDYASIYPLLDRLAKTSDEWDQLFDDIQVMESEALNVMAKQNK